MAKTDHGAPVEIEAGGRTVTITSPDKVMFPERGETKLDLARYYVAVGEPLMRTVRGPPDAAAALAQRRRRARSFFQKRIPDIGARLAADDDRGDASTAPSRGRS